jgi:type IV secretion system protein VirB4
LFDNVADGLELEAETIGFDDCDFDQPAASPVQCCIFSTASKKSALMGVRQSPSSMKAGKRSMTIAFVARIRDWETIRKRGGIVGFATQSASDALESRDCFGP